MFANALVLFLLAWMVLPGLWLARQPRALNPKLWLYIMLANTLLFAALGVLFKIMPWMIDPRVHF